MSASSQSAFTAFKGRSVFLTGHTGFKGSWLSIWLNRLGARVTGYALKPCTAPNNFDASRVREILADHHEADIRDRNALEGAIRAAAPDFVFHLAAQALVRESYRDPRETHEVNVIGTAAVLDAVRALNKPCVVVAVTTDKCYENREHVWGYRETDALGGHDPYSASKAAAELVISSYRRSFFAPSKLSAHGVKLASARAGNVIGGGDWSKDRIVTDVIRSLAEGRPVAVRSPRAIRPWQHVVEPLSGYLMLAAKMDSSHDPAFCDAWNFGPAQGTELPVGELVDQFCKVWGDGSWDDKSDPHQPHEAGCLRLNIEKAIWNLGWRPRWNIATTIDRTAQWYKAHASNQAASMRDACERDIQYYEQSITPAAPISGS